MAASISIEFADAASRPIVELVRTTGERDSLLLFTDDRDAEPIAGKVTVSVAPGEGELSHLGITVELVGQVELFYDRGSHAEFLHVGQLLAESGGTLREGDTEFLFDFDRKVAKTPHESYNGVNVRVRYFVRAWVRRSLFFRDIQEECDIWVHVNQRPPGVVNPIKMEVGIEDCLHIEFEYNKGQYHLRDVVIGKIFFLLVRVKIKHMELALVRREITGVQPNLYTETHTLSKFEIMDGSPVKGESVPVRMFLGGFALTPSYAHVEGKFSVRYLLNLVLVDEDDRRYYKQQELVLYRKRSPRKKRPHAQSNTEATREATQVADSSSNERIGAPPDSPRPPPEPSAYPS